MYMRVYLTWSIFFILSKYDYSNRQIMQSCGSIHAAIIELLNDIATNLFLSLTIIQ